MVMIYGEIFSCPTPGTLRVFFFISEFPSSCTLCTYVNTSFSVPTTIVFTV